MRYVSRIIKPGCGSAPRIARNPAMVNIRLRA
jgi:hypothetical protein